MSGTRWLLLPLISLVGCTEPFDDEDTTIMERKEPKVLICHVPPGNPGNTHEINVAAKSVAAHLAHGDYLGPCVVDEDRCDDDSSSSDDSDSDSDDSDSDSSSSDSSSSDDCGGLCGNGVVDPGEQCDDGNAGENDACRSDCTIQI